MRNKGAIIVLTVLLILISAYQLSFTFKTSQVEKAAREYAAGDEVKEKQYLDSIANQTVYNFLGIAKFTYRECKELELPLGLDLRGGMNVTMEVDVADVLKSLSNNSSDPAFNQALEEAIRARNTSTKDFVTLFGEAFERIAPNAQLASPDIFGTVEMKDRIKMGTTNREVLNVIRTEADAAIDNTFNILRTRIDKFGVAQPNIRKADISGRINIELPGIKDAQRVRKLLQGTASLEFFETYNNAEFYQYIIAANEKYRDILRSQEVLNQNSENTQEIPAVTNAEQLENNDEDEENALLRQLSEGDSLSIQSDEEMRRENPLLSIMGLSMDPNTGNIYPGSVVGLANVKDVDKINEILEIPQIKALFPRNSRLLWASKANGDVIALHAIKITTRDGRAPLDGSVITDARKGFNPQNGAPEVHMSMNAEGAKIWARLTKDNIGSWIAIILDDYVVSAPTVQNEIKGGSSQISGNFTVKEADDLANILKSGKLPAPARIIADEIVGPSLGQESIQSGMWSFVIAFLLILVYMIFFYNGKGAGLAADIALITNLFLLFGVLASLGAVLTLPGIAGIVLTMGMAVDANVLIYERVEEERRAGKGVKLALKDGYKNAYSAIIDSNLTTLITGFILYYFGEGPIKGFATTLIIGIFTSLFCAIFLSRLILDWLASKNENVPFTTSITKNWLRNVKFPFLQKRKFSYILSGALIVLSLVFLFTKGLDQGIDFVGGRTYTVKFQQPVLVEEVAESLSEVYGSAPEVKTFGGPEQVRITTKYKIDEEGVDIDDEAETLLYEGLQNFIPEGTTKEDFLTNYRLRSEKVGPAVAEDITKAAYWSVIFALLGIFLYIMFRFTNWQYGAGAIIGLAHNVLIVIGVFSAFSGLLPFSLEVDQAFIAAILTVVGYSINDTVVVFDRIREYHKLYPKRDELETTNAALNSTLRRTFNTSLSTLVVLLAIFFFGGTSIKGFVFALLIGILVGTYSSLFIATPISYDLRQKMKKKIVAKK